ncbi:hypothetical protein niasHS_011189 [Heterodera schachtii]|uniref:Spp2/MOS2 G-patch domain-containing protein n=1 Tax=Heterodera schachtii TaxID=97005 RepID=A0ABD2IYV5_HETSC
MEKATKISFSVSRRETTRVTIKCNTFKEGKEQHSGDEEAEEADEHRTKKRGILSLEDGIIVDAEPLAKREKKQLVIPVLQMSSRAQIARIQKLVDEGTATESDLARLSLLIDSLDDEQRKNTTLPLDARHQTVPTVAVADDDDPDYASVPVGEFGLAFLRGCGWKDEKSCIGKSNPQVVPLRVIEPRPKGLGLGAVLPIMAPPTANAQKAAENGDEEATTLGKHSYVRCLSGLNKGSYGQVMSMDEENASIFVELAWPPANVGKTVRVSQWAVEVVRRKEYRECVKGGSGGGGTAENGRRLERVRV